MLRAAFVLAALAVCVAAQCSQWQTYYCESIRCRVAFVDNNGDCQCSGTAAVGEPCLATCWNDAYDGICTSDGDCVPPTGEPKYGFYDNSCTQVVCTPTYHFNSGTNPATTQYINDTYDPALFDDDPVKAIAVMGEDFLDLTPVVSPVPIELAPGSECIVYDNRCIVGECVSPTVCQPDTQVVCANTVDDCGGTYECDPPTGVCEYIPGPIGATCTDGDSCTTDDTCTATGCVGTPLSQDPCAELDLDPFCYKATYCSPNDGGCIVVVNNTNQPCFSNTDPCYEDYRCVEGQCIGAPIGQAPQSSCFRDTVCTNNNGVCECEDVDQKGDGALCDDGNRCTRDTRCNAAGVCGEGEEYEGEQIECQVRTCYDSTGCDPQDGCTYVAHTAGTACTQYGQLGSCDGDGRCVLPCECLNGGVCVNADAGTCACVGEWEGPRCENSIRDALNPAEWDVTASALKWIGALLLALLALGVCCTCCCVFVCRNRYRGKIVVNARISETQGAALRGQPSPPDNPQQATLMATEAAYWAPSFGGLRQR